MPDRSHDEAIIRLYHHDRLSMREVASRVGVGMTWVRSALERNLVPIRQRGGAHHTLPSDDVMRTRDLYLHGGPGGLGMTIEEVAGELGVSKSATYERLRYYDVPMRSRSEAAALRRARAALTSGVTPIKPQAGSGLSIFST